MELNQLSQTLGSHSWLREVAFAVVVGSLWKLMASLGPGEPFGSIGAVTTSWLSVLGWETVVRLRHIGRPQPGGRLVVMAGVTSMVILVVPLGFGIGHGALASLVLIVLGAAILTDRRRTLT
jgi:hypothetical protein